MSRLLAIIAWIGLLFGAATGCRLPARTCVPPQVAMSYLRDADAPDGQFPMANPDLLSSLQQTLEKQNSEGVVPNRPPQNYLALTGGGVFGSFTVGVLCGWTDSGKRPQFDVVTGISTGALIATYAFLGPKYDSVLRDYYSNYGSREVYRPRRKLSILWSDSVVDNTPLRQKIDAACTPELLAEVAEAHRAGRRLYIGTTNLDTRQLVIWDMGAIAASGRPEARTLYRDVILASCSVPAFFPPVRIEVEINGQRYEELHVDGGATTAVFFQPFMLQLDRGNIRSRAGSNLYVINAGKIFADPDCVKPRIIKIASTTLRTMLYAGSRNDLFRLYTLALITGVNYHLAAVPQDFPMDLDALKIDPQQMRRLYEEGYRQGRTGEAWHTRLDNIGLHDDIMPRSGNRLHAWPSANTSR
jgi:predicted acylesterase/phospholipase RssA